MTCRSSERLAAALFAAAFLGGCMMLPMGGALLGMPGHGAESVGHGGQGGGHASHGSSSRGEATAAGASGEHALLEHCDSPLAIALVADDASGQGAGDTQRFALGAPSKIARALADASGCFRTLDPDPLLLSMPGGVQPDVMLRVRLARLESPDLSLSDRVGRAAQGVSARYFGGKSAIDRLERAELALQLVCAREKRVAAEFAGAAEGPLHDPPLLQEPAEAAGRENRERIAQAYARAQAAALKMLRLDPAICK
jgi:hypothetical protein